MNLVCLDSHYFQWGILGRARPSQQERKAQALEFFKILDETDATVIVPTPIITELLMGATPEEDGRRQPSTNSNRVRDSRVKKGNVSSRSRWQARHFIVCSLKLHGSMHLTKHG